MGLGGRNRVETFCHTLKVGPIKKEERGDRIVEKADDWVGR